MGGTKRKLTNTIDLTGDDSDEFETQSSYKASKTSARPVTGPGGRVYPTPPSSSYHSSSQSRPTANGSYIGPSSSQIHPQRERDSWLSTQDHEDDIRREIDLTTDVDDDVYENYQLYGVLNTKIVGVRFYNGHANVGEYVRVRREPRNPYDSNALRIDNCMGVQIGHIGRAVAAKLAPLMDSNELLLEGALTGPKAFYDCPIGLKMFGTNDPVASAQLKQKMQGLRLPVIELSKSERERKQREKQQAARDKAAKALLKTGNRVVDYDEPTNRYANLSTAGSASEPTENLDQVLSGTAAFNPRDVQDAVNKFIAGESVLEVMPFADQPHQLCTQMLPYQRQGLQWMLQKENPTAPAAEKDEPVQLWKRSRNMWTNIATNFSVTQAPPLASGGILADDMGLGKTLQVISLIMSDPHKDGRPTLIVSPLSVMSNWKHQAHVHVKDEHRPRVLIYHGQENRGLKPEQFLEWDIVVTTYATLTLELFPYGKGNAEKVPTKKGLFSTSFRRVVLDEAHSCRNPKAKMSVAACAVRAKSRWALTGTPLVNSLKDLYSQVKFLQLSGGLQEFEIFNSTLIRPLKKNDPGARILLQALMASLVLRRMKDMKFVDLKLPRIAYHRVPIRLLSHEQERYDAFKSEAKGLLEAAKAKKGDGNTMTSLLEVLLRLRQTCNHWRLCGEARIQRVLDLVEENKTIDVSNQANRKALQDLLQIRMDAQEECPVCMDSMKDPVITACAHAFCRQCIERVIETQAKCPMCRAQLTSNDDLVNPAANFGESEDELQINAEESSSKVEALLKVLKSSQGDTSKFVVFSQWTSFLDIVQTQLIKHGIRFTRLDGKMSSSQRDAAIESLNNDASCQVMLASLSVCSVGLNLVAANIVILCDSWWAPAVEMQAVDRVHRLGQKKQCKVIRLVAEDSVEDEVLAIQEKKRTLTSMAFGEREGQRSRTEVRAGTLRDIERLLR
jgi:SWI/SNF-related matrix-associated actin-dependent regulator of chromatin subfamily A3